MRSFLSTSVAFFLIISISGGTCTLLHRTFLFILFGHRTFSIFLRHPGLGKLGHRLVVTAHTFHLGWIAKYVLLEVPVT